MMIFEKTSHEIVGTISFEPHYFTQIGSFKTWITLFDTPDDDLFDGVFGEHDDEAPRILVEITSQ